MPPQGPPHGAPRGCAECQSRFGPESKRGDACRAQFHGALLSFSALRLLGPFFTTLSPRLPHPAAWTDFSNSALQRDPVLMMRMIVRRAGGGLGEGWAEGLIGRSENALADPADTGSRYRAASRRRGDGAPQPLMPAALTGQPD
eukprot:350388-Chlamydomonas_euryale.AAC.6